MTTELKTFTESPKPPCEENGLCPKLTEKCFFKCRKWQKFIRELRAWQSAEVQRTKDELNGKHS